MTAQVSSIQNPPENPCAGQPATQDGHLPSALNRLEDAIAALCDPIQHIVDGRRRETPSWFDQLVDARTGKQGTGGGGGKPVTELWLDAVMLADEITIAVQAWQPVRLACHPECVSVRGRLEALVARSWRPQDCRSIDQISGNLEAWVKEISGLLSSEARLTLPNPCPECGERTGHRFDSGGEWVRCVALQVSVDGAECTACRARWPREELPFLGRLLNYEPPAGVLTA